MAITFTRAGLQTALTAFATAFSAQNWDVAQNSLMDAQAILAGLDSAVGSADTHVQLSQTLAGMQTRLDAARMQIEKTNGGSRIVTGRTNFGAGRERLGPDRWSPPW